jgi:Ca2+-binding RTX toxin-like protein
MSHIKQGRTGLGRPRWLAIISAVVVVVALGVARPPAQANAATIQVATCEGVAADIVGTAGDDNMDGTAAGDTISLLQGNDMSDGLGGNDRVCGDVGMDMVAGGSGNDRVFGGVGMDMVEGGPDNDVLMGGSDDDTLDGGDGTDTCIGGPGNDTFINCETRRP